MIINQCCITNNSVTFIYYDNQTLTTLLTYFYYDMLIEATFRSSQKTKVWNVIVIICNKCLYQKEFLSGGWYMIKYCCYVIKSSIMPEGFYFELYVRFDHVPTRIFIPIYIQK